MLTIKETADKEAAQRFLDFRKISYSLANDIVMTCMEENEILGVASLALKDTQVYLNLLITAAEDLALQLGLAKSLMNLADLHGIKMLYGSNSDLEKIYSALRFQRSEEEYCISLEGYFTAEHK